jgi:POT family proton-dependent oligopeptide transporter
VIYPRLGRVIELTAARKIFLGMLVASVSFLLPAWVESRIVLGQVPSIGWQIAAYVILTAAEVLVSVTALEFSYTQAPQTLKSTVMSIYLLSISLGNWLTAGINYAIALSDGGSRLSGVGYYGFFAALMFVAALGFLFVSRAYEERLVLQSREG